MPAPPAARAGAPRGAPKEIIFIDSDEDDGGGGGGGGSGSRGKGAVIAGGGVGRKPVKKEPVDEAGCSRDYPGVRPRAVVASPSRPQKPRSPPQPVPLAVVHPSGQPRPVPKTVGISEEEEEGEREGEEEEGCELPGGSPFKQVLMISHEPFDGLDCNRERSAAAARATVDFAAPGSSTANLKRKRGSPGKVKANGSGGHRAVARSSRENKSGKSREAGGGGAGDRSRPAKEALAFSAESCDPSCKATRGGGTRSGGEGWSGAAPASQVGATVGSRIRSRARQGRAQYGAHSARVVVSDNTDEDGEEDEVQKEQEKEERGEEVEMMEVSDEDSGGGDNGVAQESEQDDDLQVKSREDHSDDGGGGGGDLDGGDDKEEEGEKELEEEDDVDQEDSHSIYEGDEEEDENGEEESDEDEVELDETGEEQPCRPSHAMAGGSARSVDDGTRVFRKWMFEGMYLLQETDKTSGKGIEGRTRSKTKCSDKKLLKRGTFSKPCCIDLSESSSESEEDIPAPVPPRQSSSEEENEEGIRKKTKRKRKTSRNGRGHEDSGSSDDFEKEMPSARDFGEGPSRRLKKGALNRQPVREGYKKQDGSSPGRAKYNGPKAGNPINISNAQDDISFKRNALTAKMKKRSSRAAKAAYDELFNSMFADWENHVDVPGHAQDGASLPLVFSFGDEDQVEEKSENDDLWNEFNVALESINLDSHACEEGKINNGEKVPPRQETSCKDGKHDFIIDEQVGVRCKHCNIVELEIRYVLPSMGKIPAERESPINPELDSLFKDMLTLLEKNDLLTSNGNEGTCGFGAHKAGSVWDLIPGVKKNMFPHQESAFNFMWDKLAGGTEIEQLKRAAKTDSGAGCVISHAPGTGKTRLAITFVQSYLKVFPQCSPVIIAPRGMLSTWEQEFRKWKVELPFHVLNSPEINWNQDKTIQEKVAKDETFHRRLKADKMDRKYRRLVKLASWMNGTSIIGVSYSLFRKLAKEEGMDGDEVRKLLLEKPDLLVLDEGHTPRNKKSLIWKVLAEVRTEKRIILSGTPFQNSFEELYNTLYLVRPKDAILLEKDEGKDFWTSLRLNDITEASIKKVQVILEDVVHIHSGKFLEKSLPGLRESVVILNPLPYQKEIITSMEKTISLGLDAEYKISLASVHPSLITLAKLSHKETSLVNKPKLESLRLDPSEGAKTRFVVEIVRLCEVLNERVLVFSQYLEPLNLIIEQLKTRFNWTEGKEILLMSGNVLVKNRETIMETFNNMKSGAKVMLASTKACCEGITLVGASRVVLLDVVWNPSVGRQAIGRAYRIGQKKIVYTYNLIAEGTAEKAKYDRQAKKEHMSKLLFSKEPQPGGCNLAPELICSDKILEAMTAREDLKNLFVKIYVDNQADESNWRGVEKDMPASPLE